VDVQNRYFYRSPGRIQLNTLRHPEVLGGLLDDIDEMQNDGLLTGSDRQWWPEFLTTRDGFDPVTGAILPGLPTAKPFRDFGQTTGANIQANLDRTLLRSRPGDPAQNLFEVGSSDPTLRYRLLEKALNNSTNRSNVFFVFMQIDFFEAHEDDRGTANTGDDIVRIGGKLGDSPGHRGFFVVDRSKALEPQLIDPQVDLPRSFHDPADPTSDPNDPSTWKFNFSFNQDFNFHQLILHRQTIK
jgi:hypothetical protein